MAATAAPCRCGHDRAAHEHLRRGSDCSACGPLDCVAYAAVDNPRTVTGLVLRLCSGLSRRSPAGAVLHHPTAEGVDTGRPGDPPDESVPRHA